MSGHSLQNFTGLQEPREHIDSTSPCHPSLIPDHCIRCLVSVTCKMFNAEEESYLIVPEIEPVRTFLSNALNLRLNGDKSQYDLIVDQMRIRDDPETLWKILVALCSFTYQLTKQ